jgi:hypothetical protein
MRNLIMTPLICAMLVSCGINSQKPVAQEPQPVSLLIIKIKIPRDSVVKMLLPDTTQSYSIYYPSNAQSPEKSSILICFDPHGDGRIPIDKYRKWADKFGIAIAGSNSSQNGLSAPAEMQIASNMITDINARLGFDRKKMALCGFSGGAKVAINAMANNADISNLIYVGAVTQLGSTNPIDILGFAGNQDMNYTDLLQFNESIKTSAPNAVIIEYNGKHAWPDTQIFENAFYWLTFQSWRLNLSLTDTMILQEFKANYNTVIAKAVKTKEILGNYQENEIALKFMSGLCDVSVYKENIKAIAECEEYKKAVTQKNALLGKEVSEKQVLLQAFQNQGVDWWAKVINQYKVSPLPSDKRLLGFISLASYSYSNQLLQQHNIDAAEKILAIYEVCDPINTDQLYFHALLYAQKNNNALAIKYLQKAVSNGYTDLKKIESEQSFNQLRNDPAYSQIVASVKKVSR